MQVKSIAECSKGTFIKLPFVIKIFVLSIFEWLLKTGFTVSGSKDILSTGNVDKMRISMSQYMIWYLSHRLVAKAQIIGPDKDK